MSDWPKDLTEMWAAITQVADEFNNSVAELVEEVGSAIAIELDFISTEVKELQSELFGTAWLDEFSESQSQLFNFLQNPDSQEDWPIYYEPHQAATETFQPACMGCRNYNGTTFGGNLLVCGVHPYGWQGESCPDWESE